MLSAAVALWIGILMSTGMGFAVSSGLCILILLILLVTRRARFGAQILLMVVAGVALFAMRSAPLAELKPYLGQRITAEITVTGDPVERIQRFGSVMGASFRVSARLDRLILDGRSIRFRLPIVVIGGDRYADLIPSSRVRFLAHLAKARFGTAATLVAQGSPESLDEASHLQRATVAIRRGLQIAVNGAQRDGAGLLPGLVLGDTSKVDQELTADMKTTGLTHLTAVSGANLAILSALLLAIMRWLRSPRWLTIIFVASFLAFFILLVRPQPSVLRAGAMAAVLLVAYGRGVARSALPALAAAIFFLLLIDPWQALSFGFALSVAATAGLLVIAPTLTAKFERHMPRWLAHGLAIPLSAQVVCAPLILALSGNLSLIGVAANFFSSPLVAPATIVGLLAALLSILWMPLAHVVAVLGALPAALIAGIAHEGARVPFASLAWGSSPVAIALLVLLLIVIALLMKKHLRFTLVGIAIALCALITTSFLPSNWPPPEWIFAMCDVGQGDGYVLNAGNGKFVVVDAGPDPQVIDKALSELGVQDIALLILTHDHADHVEGLPGVLHGRKVREIWVSPLDNPTYEVSRIKKWTKGSRVIRAPAGERQKIGNIEVNVIWPQRILDPASPNNSSIAILVSAPWGRFFLAADLEEEAQSETLSYLLQHPELPAKNVDILKVAHHGSAKQSPLLIAYLHPRIAVISVGKGNPYHHPASSTVALLAHEGATIWRTDRDGDLAITQKLKVFQKGRSPWR